MNAALPLLGVVIFGWLAGMLVNYLADVLPLTRTFTGPALCVHCQQVIPWPGYLAYRPCPECAQPRGWRTWAVQVGYPLIFAWQWLQPNGRLTFLWAAGLLVFFGLVAVIDLEYRAILDPVSVVGAVIGLATGWLLHGPLMTIAGGAAGFLIMLLLYYGGDLFARWLAKRRNQETDEVALGFGDVKLAGILGLILGWPGIIAGLILGIFFGGVAGLVYIVYTKIAGRYEAFSAIPYAPFLILGALVLLLRP